ncbi:ammecr1 [Anaeramoeba ignava]|uniref:Ammecr1 n=1 Tax=Anaeramoeba ignava TaxID=1746090 RepID=A0A9Q0LYU3_ANAIG|nr:ammecr1 [Anaeramoeba ignava]
MTEIIATKEMCYFAFETLLSQFDKKFKMEKYSFSEKVSCPLFVTLKKAAKGSLKLRGCIGTFEDKPLESGLREFTKEAAFRDPRFSKLENKEIPSLTIGISLLINFEKAQNYLDWEVGKHGIRISLDGYGATFLPEVAPEQGWDKETTIFYLVRKSHYYGDLDHDAKNRIQLTRYQSSKISASYEEYLDWKKKMESNN